MPDWIEVALRSVILLITLFFITKWLGKKQLSELNIFEYITGIVLGGIVAIHGSTTNDPLIHGMIAMFIWFIIPYIAEFISMKSKSFRDFQGKSTIIIQDGKIMEENMKKERYLLEDLLEDLRAKDIFNVSDVEFALLEPSGRLNAMLKKEQQPLTPKALGIQVSSEKEPETVIMDGEMLLEPLANLSLNPRWLEEELDKLNVSIENVFLGQVDGYGQLPVDLYDDQIVVPEPTEKPLLLATLKKCQADLELFALETENDTSKQMYEKNSQKLQRAINEIKPYLT